MNVLDTLENLVNQTAFMSLTVGNYIMIVVACVFLYLAIKKGYERERDAVMAEEKTIGVIKAELKAASEEMLPSFISAYETDTRNGVQTLVSQAKKRLEKLQKEMERIEKLKRYERAYGEDHAFICGIDEVGRGPLAGPVVAGAVILPKDDTSIGINQK